MCDERWTNITRSIMRRGAMGLSTPPALKQPTWCTLPPDKFSQVAGRVTPPYPENILFTFRGALPPDGADSPASDEESPPLLVNISNGESESEGEASDMPRQQGDLSASLPGNGSSQKGDAAILIRQAVEAFQPDGGSSQASGIQALSGGTVEPAVRSTAEAGLISRARRRWLSR